MTRVVLLSDNHSYFHDEILPFVQSADEVWHAGDIGLAASIQPIIDRGKKFRAVYGNIDGQDIRLSYKETEVFTVEGVKVVMTHIGGYPGKYAARIQALLSKEKPALFICGHSHILKVMPDHKNKLLHMNPGAYGHHGFHVVRTILTFSIHDGIIQDVKAVELGLRGR